MCDGSCREREKAIQQGVAFDESDICEVTLTTPGAHAPMRGHVTVEPFGFLRVSNPEAVVFFNPCYVSVKTTCTKAPCRRAPKWKRQLGGNYCHWIHRRQKSCYGAPPDSACGRMIGGDSSKSSTTSLIAACTRGSLAPLEIGSLRTTVRRAKSADPKNRERFAYEKRLSAL